MDIQREFKPNYRIAIGTKVQSCHCCHADLKKEPFIRMDWAVRSWGGKNACVNICYRCVREQSKAINKALRNSKIVGEMMIEKIG